VKRCSSSSITLEDATSTCSHLSESLNSEKHHEREADRASFRSQTWFLVFLLVLFNGLDWICFWLLDIGNPVLEAMSPGVRCIDGLFQALAVRTAGFAIVNLGQVAPALQFLFAIMMYIVSLSCSPCDRAGRYELTGSSDSLAPSLL